MQTKLIDPVRDPALDCGILSYLPPRLADEISSLGLSRVEEIRVRCERTCSLTDGKKNVVLSSRVDRKEMDETVKKMCGGSLYAYSDTINKGYIIMPRGTRVGICGRAVTLGGGISGVYDVSSLCIRLAHPAPAVGGRICELLSEADFCGGVLIYSPPGIGKTTLLRAVIASISKGRDPKRVAVIDTRGELGCFLPSDVCVDMLSGYPRGIGIEIAARTLNPQLIVCDEIGADRSEAEAIAAAHNCGVPLLASAHAGSISELRQKIGISMLHERGVFSYYVGISRADSKEYSYSVCHRDDI